MNVGDELHYQIVEPGVQEYQKSKSVNPNGNGNGFKGRKIDEDAILYQNHFSGLMNYYTMTGFPDSFGPTEKERLDAFSDTLLYLCKKSKENIQKLKS